MDHHTSLPPSPKVNMLLFICSVLFPLYYLNILSVSLLCQHVMNMSFVFLFSITNHIHLFFSHMLFLWHVFVFFFLDLLFSSTSNTTSLLDFFFQSKSHTRLYLAIAFQCKTCITLI